MNAIRTVSLLRNDVRQWIKACAAHDLAIDRATKVLCAEISAEHIVAWGLRGVWRTGRFTSGIHERIPPEFFAHPFSTILCDGWATRGWDATAQDWADWKGPEWGDVRFKRDEALKLRRRNFEGTTAVGSGAQANTEDVNTSVAAALPTLPDDTRPSTPDPHEFAMTKLQFDSGYITWHLLDGSNENIIELIDPYILLHEEKLSALMPMLALLEAVVQSGRPFLIIAQDVDGELLATLVVNKQRGGLKVAAVRAPGFGDSREAIMQDIAAFTGGMVVNDSLGIRLERVTLDNLGTAKRVVIEKDRTTIFEGGGKTIGRGWAGSIGATLLPAHLPTEVAAPPILLAHTVPASSRTGPPSVPAHKGKSGRPTRRRKSFCEQLTDALIQIHRDGTDITRTHRGKLHGLAIAAAGIGATGPGNSRPTFERALADAIDLINGG
jgi:hypothetical protein